MKKLLALVIALMVALAMVSAFAEDVQEIALGTSGFSVFAPASYVKGEITAEDTDESQVAYYMSEESTLDFDIYQWAKAEGETLESIATAEAAEFGAEVGNDVINGITVYFYGAKEEYDGVEYDTESYLMENGDFIAEIVFWLEEEADQDEMGQIILSLTVGEAVEIDEGGTEIVLGTSNLKITTPVAYVQGEITAEDTDENQVAYYTSEESLIDFDVYQWAKVEGETAETVAAAEAAEFGAEEYFEGISNSGIVFEGYYASEEYDGQTFETLTIITEAGDDFVEIVFWIDGENIEEAELVVTSIIASLTAI